MMPHAGLRAFLLGLALAGGAAAVVALRVPLAPGNTGGESPPEGQLTPPVEAQDALDSVVIQRNAFRSDRRPAPVRFEPGGQTPPSMEPRPPLSVAGVVLGRTRAALLRGLPGVDGVRVLAEGEAAAGVRVLRVADRTVVVTWRSDTLSLRVTGGGS
jgi:hypothetical protein